MNNEKLPLVLIHGWGMNDSVFKHLSNQYNGHKVILLELPGHGDALPAEAEFDCWCQQLQQQLPERCVLAGWSLGGMLAMALAQRLPSQVGGLVTIAASPSFSEREDWPGMRPSVLRQFGRQLATDHATTIERFMALQAMGSSSAKDDIRSLKKSVLARPLAAPIALQQGLDFLANVDLRSQLATIDQPWLRVWGKLDGLVPVKVANRWQHNANSQDFVIAKASHAPFVSHQQEFEQGLSQWLQEHF